MNWSFSSLENTDEITFWREAAHVELTKEISLTLWSATSALFSLDRTEPALAALTQGLQLLLLLPFLLYFYLRCSLKPVDIGFKADPPHCHVGPKKQQQSGSVCPVLQAGIAKRNKCRNE